jgi:hypothetical protein
MSSRQLRVLSERWRDERRYWACTWCSAVMAARLELGDRPEQTEREVRALAAVSGDTDLRLGSNTRELVVAVRRRYGLRWRSEAIDRRRFDQLTAHAGFGLVCGVTAGRMPASVRRYHGSFTGGHRLLALAEGRRDRLRRPLVRILDPLMPQGSAGVEIRAAELWPALWTGEIVIVHEGR